MAKSEIDVKDLQDLSRWIIELEDEVQLHEDMIRKLLDVFSLGKPVDSKNKVVKEATKYMEKIRGC